MTADHSPSTPLCRLEDIPDNGSAGFVVPVNGEMARLLAVRRGSIVYLYINSCPHTHAPLDFTPGQFLNLEKTLIMCSSHGALFRIEDGHCVQGPCAGNHLTKVACSVRNDEVWLD
ncbi:Rieske (2Fe-2S) protein [Magnetovibrio blakemorei]|uniref:Rieske domain-containing protein n=1 Tax=Magnetovibrio blakemorei TaxID=28181 RepID=A0A1E5Q3M0_9PROT|nr:Rieske 2Fe-2S domain-containing protein [Magnetovibrio blakemorei]OEJ64091.1 hypothetical protein BEN30_01425 [Magnetovibrio blakemorei]